LINSKVFLGLALIVVLTYVGFWVLGQFDWFRKYKDAGVTFAFEAVMGMVALVVGFIGIYLNGYMEGLKDGKTESN